MTLQHLKANPFLQGLSVIRQIDSLKKVYCLNFTNVKNDLESECCLFCCVKDETEDGKLWSFYCIPVVDTKRKEEDSLYVRKNPLVKWTFRIIDILSNSDGPEYYLYDLFCETRFLKEDYDISKMKAIKMIHELTLNQFVNAVSIVKDC